MLGGKCGEIIELDSEFGEVEPWGFLSTKMTYESLVSAVRNGHILIPIISNSDHSSLLTHEADAIVSAVSLKTASPAPAP